MFVIQYRTFEWDKWKTSSVRCETVKEALNLMLPNKPDKCHRIAEAYTVTRYKPVKNPA